MSFSKFFLNCLVRNTHERAEPMTKKFNIVENMLGRFDYIFSLSLVLYVITVDGGDQLINDVFQQEEYICLIRYFGFIFLYNTDNFFKSRN